MSKHASPAPETIRHTTEPTGELERRIRLRAYELFEQRGGEHGHDLEDWLQAELELIQRKPEKTAA